MNKKQISTTIVLFLLCCLSQSVGAAGLQVYEPLKLDLPELQPKLVYGQKAAARPDLSLPPASATDERTWREKWTFMHTNPGVQPYKVMDDLTFVGVPVFLAGIIVKSEKTAFRQNDGTRHVLLTNFKTHIDDYTQYFGPAMTIGLKVGGVEGRSDWGRLLASAAMSYGIMAGLVNGIKYTAKEMRPDGSTANSWPSGHTATSFVGATILHKEYGLTRSPWYSVAGYGVATATGVMRVLNNRHWVSDVLSGAGIGIMSTELAYALSDVIFKGKGLLRNDLHPEASIIDHPSFFSISMGMGFGSKDLTFDLGDTDPEDDFHLKFRTSTAVSVEAAYFFNKYLGVGGRLRVNASPINGWDRVMTYAQNDVKEFFQDVNDDVDLQELQDLVDNTEEQKPEFKIQSDHLTEFAADLGLYFNFPLSRRFALGAKVLGGRSIMQELNLSARFTGNQKEMAPLDDENFFRNTGKKFDSEWDYFTLGANNTMKLGTGISLTFAYKNNFSWKVFADYDFTRKAYTLTYNPTEFIKDAIPDFYQEALNDPEVAAELEMSQRIKKNRHTIIIGGSFAISF